MFGIDIHTYTVYILLINIHSSHMIFIHTYIHSTNIALNHLSIHQLSRLRDLVDQQLIQAEIKNVSKLLQLSLQELQRDTDTLPLDLWKRPVSNIYTVVFRLHAYMYTEVKITVLIHWEFNLYKLHSN